MFTSRGQQFTEMANIRQLQIGTMHAANLKFLVYPARLSGTSGIAGLLGADFLRHYDVELEIHRDHELVRTGPYRVVRHPLYAGLALHFAGACIATGNLVLIAGTILVTYPALYYRARVEERLLRDRFGAAYDEYARRVGMLVPLL